MPATANLPTLAVALCDPCIWLLALDGIGRPALIWMHRILGVLTVLGLLSLPTTLFVIHDNWQCYEDDGIQAVTYGRCTEVTAQIHQHPELERKSGTRPLSTAEWTGIAIVGIISALFLFILTVRMICIGIAIHALSLPPLDHKKHDATLLSAAHDAPVRFFTRRNVTLLYAARHIKRIILFGPVSFYINMPAIAMHLSALWCIAQIFLCNGMIACLAVMFLADRRHQLEWGIAAGCFAFLALVNHGVKAVRFNHWMNESLREADKAVRVDAPSTSTDPHSSIMDVITHACYKP